MSHLEARLDRLATAAPREWPQNMKFFLFEILEHKSYMYLNHISRLVIDRILALWETQTNRTFGHSLSESSAKLPNQAKLETSR